MRSGKNPVSISWNSSGRDGIFFFLFRVFICDFFGLSDVSSFLVVVIRMELRCEILLISLFELIDRGVLKRKKKLSDFSS